MASGVTEHTELPGGLRALSPGPEIFMTCPGFFLLQGDLRLDSVCKYCGWQAEC
jgi:hypothetical protein